MLFNKYSTLTYTIGNNQVSLVDIFTRVIFLNDYSSSRAYDQYTIQEGESPEDVSHIVYGNEYYSWLILLINNIISEDEWYSGDAKFQNILNTKHQGESYYITNLPNLIPGDLIVKVISTNDTAIVEIDENTFRYVSDFNLDFRFIWGTNGKGTFNVDDKIMFARKNKQTGIISPITFKSSDDPTLDTQWTKIKYIEQKKDSPLYFMNIENISIPPNVIFSWEPPRIQNGQIPYNTIYTNPDDLDLNFADTILYYYMLNFGNVPGIRKFTYAQNELNKYKGRQTIKILKPEYVSRTVFTIESMLDSQELGKRITIGF